MVKSIFSQKVGNERVWRKMCGRPNTDFYCLKFLLMNTNTELLSLYKLISTGATSFHTLWNAEIQTFVILLDTSFQRRKTIHLVITQHTVCMFRECALTLNHPNVGSLVEHLVMEEYCCVRPACHICS